MRSPQLDQKAIKVPQVPMKHVLNWGDDVGVGVDGDFDLLEVFEFDGFERFGDPLDVLDVRQKGYIFEFCGFGEVKGRWLPRRA